MFSSAVLAFLILNVVIALHELGHLIAARLVGIPVKTFSIGMGKPFLRLWSVVMPFDEELNVRNYRFQIETGKSFRCVFLTAKHRSTKNFILDCIARIMRETMWCLGRIPIGGFISLPEIKSPVKETIVSAAGPFANFLTAFVIGVIIYVIKYDLGLIDAALESVTTIGIIVEKTFNILYGMIFEDQPFRLSGPIGIVTIGSRIPPTEFINFLSLAASLSVGVGFMNMIPIIPLDGGRILFAWINTLVPHIGRLLEKMTKVVTSISLLLLMIFITIKDILNLF